MEPSAGLEPATYRLQGDCSAEIELAWQKKALRQKAKRDETVAMILGIYSDSR